MSRRKNIFERYPDYTKEQIINAIIRLKKKDQLLLQRAFTESYDNSDNYSKLSEEEQSRVKTIIHYNLKNRLENPSFAIENIQTIFDKYPDYTSEQVWDAFYQLSENQQSFLIEIYGKNLTILDRIETLSTSQKEKLKKIVNESLYKKLNTSKRIIPVKNVFERFPEYSKEEILEAISRLNKKDQELLYLAYGQDLTDRERFSSLGLKEKEIVKNIVSFSIKKRLDNKNLLPLTCKKNSIFDYYEEYSKSQVLEAISRLSTKDQQLLQEAYGISYDEDNHYEYLSTEKKEVISNILRKQLKLRLENPQTKQTKAKTAFEHFKNYSKEEVLEAINKLSEEDQERLRAGFGNHYDDVSNYSTLPSYEKSRIIRIINRKIRAFLEHPDKRIKQCNNILEYYEDYSIQEIADAINRLPEEQKELVYSTFGIDLNITNQYSQLSSQDKEKIRYILNKPLLERLKKPEKRESQKGKKVQTILERYPNKSMIELEFAINQLTKIRQDILKKAFGEKYDSRDNYDSLTKEEKRSVQVATTQLKVKIKRIEEYGLLGYYSNASHEKIKNTIESLPEEHQRFLKGLFGDHYNQYHDLLNLSENDIMKLNSILQTINELLGKKIEKKKVEKISSLPRKKRVPKSLKDYFASLTINEIEEMISYLPISDQNLLQKAYGSHYDTTEGLKELSQKDATRVFYVRSKMKRVAAGEKKIETLNPNRRMGQDAKSLVEYLKDYSKEEIIKAIESLSFEEQSILKKAYGIQYDETDSYYLLEKEEKRKVQILKNKVKNIILGKLLPEQSKSRKRKTMKEYFQEYSTEDIQRVLLELTEEERILLEKAYGNELDSFDTFHTLSDREKKKVYKIKWKMKQKLDNKEQPLKKRKKKNTEKKKKNPHTIKQKAKNKKEKKSTKQSNKEKTSSSENRSSIYHARYIPLSRQKELKWMKASKLSYYEEVDDIKKKEYLQYYFEVYPLRRKKYEVIIQKMIEIKGELEEEYIYYAHEENGLQNHQHININFLKEKTMELKLLEKKRRELLEIYITDSKEKRDKFLENNQRLVASIARSKAFMAPFEDLMSEGNIGMMKALKKFDIQSGNKFSTYATWWITQAISRYLKSGVKTIRIPVYREEEIRKKNKITEQLSLKLYRKPTIEEISEATGYSIQKIEEIMENQFQSYSPISLSQEIAEESSNDFNSIIGIEDNAFVEAENRVLLEQFIQYLEKAPLIRIEKEVIIKRFGLVDDIPRTIEELSKEYQLSKERIRQIELNALKKLRMALKNDHFFQEEYQNTFILTK